MGRRLALIVATYEYDDPGLRQLTAPRRDAEELAAVLGNEDIGGFEVTTLVNEPHRTVGAAIGDFYSDARPNDLTLLYFSGHGLKSDSGKLFLAMKDTHLRNKLFTSVTADQVNEAVDDSASRQKILILDCCYAGAFPVGTRTKSDDSVHVLQELGGRGRVVLTASDATQYAFEGDSLTQDDSGAQSIFTRHLIAGIRDGSADRDNDGDITVDELYDYVHQKLAEERPEQRPKKQESVSGRTVVAQNIHWSIPEDIRRTLEGSFSDYKLQALQYLDQIFATSRNALVKRKIRDAVERVRDTEDSRKVEKAATDWLEAHPVDDAVRPINTTGPRPVAPTRSPAAELAPPVVPSRRLPPEQLDAPRQPPRWQSTPPQAPPRYAPPQPHRPVDAPPTRLPRPPSAPGREPTAFTAAYADPRPPATEPRRFVPPPRPRPPQPPDTGPHAESFSDDGYDDVAIKPLPWYLRPAVIFAATVALVVGTGSALAYVLSNQETTVPVETTTVPPPPTVTTTATAPPTSTSSGTRQCWNGTRVPAGQSCPISPTNQTCASGTTKSPSGSCVTVTYCEDGNPAPAGGTCPSPEPSCPDGSPMPASGTCPPTKSPCPDGNPVSADGTCPTSTPKDGSSDKSSAGSSSPVVPSLRAPGLP